MRKAFLLCLMTLSTLVYARDHRVTKEEFLDLVIKGSISLERSPIWALPPNYIDKIFETEKKKWPALKEEMLYYYYYNDNKFRYTLNIDWSYPSCLLRIEEVDPTIGKPNAKTLDPVGQTIDKKYCEKVFGITY